MLGAREVAGWADEYQRECLAGRAMSQQSNQPDLVGCWRVETSNTATGPAHTTTHFVEQIPKRT